MRQYHGTPAQMCPAKPLITVRVDWGKTDTEIVTYESAPRFKVGETVLIFVGDKEPDSIYGDK